jgi:hypothetical protein
MHSFSFSRLALVEYFPARQLVHEDFLGPSLNFPGAHARQLVDRSLLHLPIEQDLHTVPGSRSVSAEPAVQLLHEVDEGDAYCPASHLAHGEEGL